MRSHNVAAVTEKQLFRAMAEPSATGLEFAGQRELYSGLCWHGSVGRFCLGTDALEGIAEGKLLPFSRIV